MALVIKGSNAFTEQPKRRNWTAATGWVTTREWRGPNTDSLVRAKETAVQNLGAESIDTDTGIPAVISAKFTDLNGGATPVDIDNSERNAVWELIPLEVDKVLESCPRWNHAAAAANKTDASAITKIKDFLKKGDFDSAYALGGAYQDYAKLKTMGVETYTRYVFTIRKSYSIESASPKQLHFPNTMKVISYAAIGITPRKGSSIIRWEQPKYYEMKEDTTVTWDNGTPINQWLEAPPSIRYNEATKKTDITIEWHGQVAYSGLLYNGGTHGL